MAASQPELVITRLIAATPETVFKAFTDPGDMLRWGGPQSHPMVATQGDVRPGGRWNATLRSPEGEELKQSGVWREVDRPKRLAYTFGWDGEMNGAPRRETLINIDLEPQPGGKTRMTFKQGPFDTDANRDGHHQGWSSAFDRLDAYLH